MTDAEKKVLDEEVVVESVDVEVGTMEDVDAIMKKFDRESNTRVWEGTPKLILRYVLAAFMLFMVYMNLWATWSGQLRRCLFVGFVILFLCYVESGIANFFPEGAGSSFFAFFIIIALVCLWIGSMIKNPIITGVIAVIGEGALTAVYFTKSTLLEGKIQDLLGVFNMAGHMDNFVNGILDIGGVVYYLSVIAICTFLAMQSLQKKRWN